ncbi:QDR2 [Candida pseudojiufengensis]|uniref:QDR2 n=1 Tax=Candida pseudojiufengensis TaxID=497109 RepID=UPI0022254BB4|nr:QDR2 [Candida pseudojiufengensis]KAI5962444.1 QDR2 [Candida pseudojiufengensis]
MTEGVKHLETQISLTKVNKHELQSSTQNRPKVASTRSSTFRKVPYTILHLREEIIIVIITSLSGIWSTLSTSIYFPALPQLSDDFQLSPQIINISIVSYLIFQGITPTLIGTISDSYGRRPSILICLLSYCLICIAISFVNVYWAIAVLRCFQAAAIAPIISVTSAIMSDITETKNRGKFIGANIGLQLVGQAFGSLIGSLLLASFDTWRVLFLFLAIGSGCVMIVVLIVLPETNRKLVGNLSVKPTNLLSKAPIIYIPYFQSRLNNANETIQERTPVNYLDPFKILFQPMIFMSMLASGFQFTAFTMCLTSMSTSLQIDYGFSIIKVGLCYLAPGLGTLLGSIITGRIIDLLYGRQKNRHTIKYCHLSKEERPEFNIIESRFQTSIYTTLLIILFLIVFGWCLQFQVHIAPILISTFLISIGTVSFMSCMNTLLLDLFPDKGSSATACLNIVRCLLAAAGIGALQSLVDRIGIGGTYTLMSSFVLASFIVLLAVKRYIQNQT